MMKKILAYLFVVIAFVMQANAQVNWTKHPGNPVLLRGANGEWDDELVAGPYVIFDGDTYHMWYAGYDGSTGTNVGYATSSDGVSWTKYNDPATISSPYADSDPVLKAGPSSWDGVVVYQPCVIYNSGMYHMWFAGHDGSNNRQIGYATSPDGIVWTKYSGNPVLKPGTSGSWDDVWVDSPEVLFINGVFHMWYSGNDGNTAQSGHATSPDGIIWTKDPLNPVLKPGNAGSWDAGDAYQPAVLFYGNTYYMWYSGGAALKWSIGYAYSTDGSNWTKYIGNPVVIPGSLGSWDYAFTGLSGVFFNEDSTGFNMWYTGSSASQIADWDIGFATAPKDLVVPVELTSFTALASGKEVILNWSTATEINNYGFEIQRSTSGKEFSTVGFKGGNGTTSEDHNYNYADKNLNNGKYFYRLKQIDFDGSYDFSIVIEVEFRSLNSFLLEQNYPNPFNPTTTIGFGVRDKSNVKLAVLNSIGEQVALLLNENKEPGFYQVEFIAANFPSGVYFYQLTADNFIETKKMILLK